MNNILEQLDREGFIFKQYDPSIIDFHDLSSSISRLKSYIEEIISISGESLFYDIDTIEYKQQIKPHYHVIPGTFQVVAWIPEDNFEGRKFIFGTQKSLNTTTPKLGYFCIMKPNDPHFIHGVTSLQSKTSIRSIGFSSLIKKVEGNQDIFAQNPPTLFKDIPIESLIN
ncbi:hypothetical protein [Halobacteriovorax sp. HLS]|uniref:hypothetical protein n=1 Tax=Halobacteriovorax sp. HLS TaxID=2234000 RepID=UPI000FDC2A2A|nr:hypothetical protein [Halobacteriovorax sp. HLS]